MLVFRVERERYLQTTLSGIGASTKGFRWNSINTQLVYTAESRALATLEVMVHLDLSEDLPSDRYYVTIEIPDEVREFTEAYMLENNPVGAWLRQHYEMTGHRDDCIQKSELYRTFLEDTGIHKTQKAFSEDIVKCNVGEKVLGGTRYYFGLVRK